MALTPEGHVGESRRITPEGSEIGALRSRRIDDEDLLFVTGEPLGSITILRDAYRRAPDLGGRLVRRGLWRGRTPPGQSVRVEHDVGATPTATETRTRSPWILLFVPAAVGLYALIGAVAHPLMVGPDYDSFECDVRRPWEVVMLVSWLTGAILILVAIVVAITGRWRTGLSIAVTGILLIAAGAIVAAVAVANDFHLCAS